jgi:hypothetical protein
MSSQLLDPAAFFCVGANLFTFGSNSPELVVLSQLSGLKAFTETA